MENPMFNLFEPPMRDDSVTEYDYVEYQPRDADMDKDGQIIIETKDLDSYLYPHNAVLEVRGRLVKASNDSNYAATDQVALVNNGWSLFKTLEYKVNDKLIESIADHAPIASTIMNLVQFSDDYSRSSASNQFWYRDTGTGAADAAEYVAGATVLPAGTVGDNAQTATGKNLRDAFDAYGRNTTYNAGFKARQLLCTGDQDVCMYLPLKSVLGFCKDIDTVFMGVKHSLNLTRADPANYIHRVGSVAGRFKIKHISLWMPRVTPSLQIQTDLESKLVGGYMRDLYFEQSRIHKNTFGTSEKTATWRVATQSNEELPTHIFVCLQSATRDDAQTENNQVFDNGQVTSMSVYINNTRWSERDLETDFSTSSKNYGRAYMLFQEAVQKYSDTDSGSQVSAEEYAGLYPIFHFDVSKHKEKLRHSSADVELRWKLASKFEYPVGTETSYNVYCLILSERFLKLESLSGRMNVIV